MSATTRTYVLILFFWAVLTVVTPMLIRLSASAKLYTGFDGLGKEGMKLSLPRRALVAARVSEAPVPVPAPLAAQDGGGGFGVEKISLQVILAKLIKD